MIKTQNLVPEIYYKESRDFQFFGRLYDMLFNYLKTEIDLIRSFPLNNNQDTDFLELILRTLGFRSKRDYQTNQLQALASCWVDLVRNKGSLQSIENLVKCILRAENITGSFLITYDINSYDIPTVVIQIPDLISSQESSLIEEALNYLMPIGVGFVVQDTSVMSDFEPMNLYIEERTSLNRVKRSQLRSLAKNVNEVIDETEETSGYTGTYEDRGTGDTGREGKVKVGSIKVGAIAKKKSEE